MDSDDARDIQASLNGDGEAYGRLVGRYQNEIAGQLRWFARGPTACEELVQEVFVEAYYSLPGFKGKSPWLHWLRKIATRVGYRYLKQHRRRRDEAPVQLQDWDGMLKAPEALPPEEAGETLHALLAQLPPRDRLVLTLMYLEERSVAEIASLLGWTRTMVKVQAFRARGKLRKLLERQESQP